LVSADVFPAKFRGSGIDNKGLEMKRKTVKGKLADGTRVEKVG